MCFTRATQRLMHVSCIYHLPDSGFSFSIFTIGDYGNGSIRRFDTEHLIYTFTITSEIADDVLDSIRDIS